jgi:aldose 1-epimerase
VSVAGGRACTAELTSCAEMGTRTGGSGQDGGAKAATAGVSPSGEQFQLVHGEQRATIVEVGGGVRRYAVGERDVLDPYPLRSICDGAHGAPLIPWPNRVADGRYRFEGMDYQLALTEPGRHNATHGLLRWRSWRALERAPERVVMAIRLHPLPGYPFMLDVRIEYELGDGGLAVTSTTTNIGESACPYGSGQHPYLSPGRGLIDACELTVPAGTRILTDERRLPCGREPVAGSAYDFQAPRRLGGTQLDDPFTDLLRDERGLAVSSLAASDGSTAELWVDAGYPYLQLYSGEGLQPERRRRGLGVEPLSCPANAFQSGEGLIRLAAGESTTARWGARLR